jgi:flagellin
MAKVTGGVSDSDASVISASKAYGLIKTELRKASSIGADAGKEATVADPTSTDVYSTSNTQITFTITEGTVKTTQGLQMGLHVGADADETNKITFNIDTMSSAGLGVQNLNLVDKTGAKATYAIDAIADAIQKVSAQRSELGAVQNRLEHTINNLDNVVENTTSAESQIRDTDMAEEMVEYSKNNILAQAGQSMLAQANQATQGVLSLLQ